MIERYSRPVMAALWSQENKFAVWLEVELAICDAWNRLGQIPDEAMAEIKLKAKFDMQRILEIEDKTRHDVIAFLSAVEENVGPASRFIHLGCTSSDIVDTANGLLLCRAGEIILAGVDKLLFILKEMAIAHKGLLCIGRTHGMHAEPISFGLKMAGFFSEFFRHRERFSQAVSDIRVGKISGAVGTYAHLDPRVEEIACELLGLAPDPISTQIIQRDRHAYYLTTLALMAGGVERICTELRHLQRTEVLEVEENFSKDQQGSSAMPHKKNPISAENLCGLSRLVRSNSLAAQENMALWHERDISHSSVERVIMPDSTVLMDYILYRLANILEKLQVIPENMERNLMGSYGLFYSQRVFMTLLNKGLSRQQAYEVVQKVAMRCWKTHKSFLEEVRRDLEIIKYLSVQDVDVIFDPLYYLRHEDMIMSRVFGN